jgi:tetratricopeptide (TPR) repeat protein
MEWLTSAWVDSASTSSGSGIFDNTDPTSIFDALTQQQNGMENLSNQFLQAGIDQYLNKKYEEAAKSFEAAVSLAPNSSFNADSSKYLVQTYLRLEKTDKAIETYKAAIQRNPDRDDLMASLGQLYFAESKYEESAAQYKAAVQVNPSSTNRYSYGEALIKVGNYSEAEHQFQEVKRLEPDSYAGDYGLGKLYAQTEDYDHAIEHFEKALKLDPTFYDAQAEIGYTYADMGEIEKARNVQEQLAKKDEDLAGTLESYIDEKEPPQIAFAYANSSFPYNASKGYELSNIDSYLANSGAEKSFTMKFLFTKEMDSTSIANRFNWSISRASSANIAETYNYGDAIPDTEVSLDPYPDYVYYDADSLTATVGFTIRQNATADGTIDPSHIVFKFSGEDIYGQSMDAEGDEFSGFSGSA